jgi:uncharacterized protein (TIRG00374 family)
VSQPGSIARRALVGIVFGIAVYSGMVFWRGWSPLVDALSDFPLWVLPAACALSFGNYALRFIKWQRYLHLLDVRLPRGLSWQIYLAGFSMGVTPGKMGEVLKSWLLRKAVGTPVHHTAPIVVAERFTDLTGYLLLIAVGGIASQPDYLLAFGATAVLCLVGMALAGSRSFARLSQKLVARTPYFWRLAPKVEGSFRSVRVLLRPREVVFPTLLSMVSWGLECAGFWLIVNGISDHPIPFLFCVFAYALSAVAGALAIIVPGGLGVTEGLLGTLTRREIERPLVASLGAKVAMETARSQATAAVILGRLATLWFGVLVGFVALGALKRRLGRIDFDENGAAAQPARPANDGRSTADAP